MRSDLKNSIPSSWKRRKTTSSATFCATGMWGLNNGKHVFQHQFTFFMATFLALSSQCYRLIRDLCIFLTPHLQYKLYCIMISSCIFMRFLKQISEVSPSSPVKSFDSRSIFLFLKVGSKISGKLPTKVLFVIS